MLYNLYNYFCIIVTNILHALTFQPNTKVKHLRKPHGMAKEKSHKAGNQESKQGLASIEMKSRSTQQGPSFNGKEKS